MHNKTLYTGCDVSATKNYVCDILSYDSKKFSTAFENHIKGVEKILDIIVSTDKIQIRKYLFCY